MKMILAKVLATGEVINATEKRDEKDVFVELFGKREFKADELEVLSTGEVPDDLFVGDDASIRFPKYEPMDTTAMVKEMIDQREGHFWRDQRVEITKILLKSANPFSDLSPLVEKADEIVQKLKAYGD